MSFLFGESICCRNSTRSTKVFTNKSDTYTTSARVVLHRIVEPALARLHRLSVLGAMLARSGIVKQLEEYADSAADLLSSNARIR